MTGPGDSEQSDADLFAASQAGDRTALEALLLSYLPRLTAFVRSRLTPDFRARESGADFVQSACREVLAHASTFQFTGEAEFRSWLFTIALNKIRERAAHFATQKRGQGVAPETLPTDGVPDRQAALASPSQVAMGHEFGESVQRALQRLPEAYREVITLSRISGLSHAEIAQQTGKSEGAIRVLLSRALLRLVAEIQTSSGQQR